MGPKPNLRSSQQTEGGALDEILRAIQEIREEQKALTKRFEALEKHHEELFNSLTITQKALEERLTKVEAKVKAREIEESSHQVLLMGVHPLKDETPLSLHHHLTSLFQGEGFDLPIYHLARLGKPRPKGPPPPVKVTTGSHLIPSLFNLVVAKNKRREWSISIERDCPPFLRERKALCKRVVAGFRRDGLSAQVRQTSRDIKVLHKAKAPNSPLEEVTPGSDLWNKYCQERR